MTSAKPMAGPDPRAKSLKRMQALALSLLGLAVAGLVLSQWMGAQGPWAWAKAFCEAAAVGALADWFAVVALFKRPLGLPIPHTAIIPASKGRIADSLAAFVRDHFLDPQTLLSKLSVFDPAARLGQWISQPENVHRLSGSVRAIALEAFDLLDETAVRQAIHQFVVAKVRTWNAADLGGDVLSLLTQDGRHHDMLDAALLNLSSYLDQPDTKHKLSDLMVKHARTEWPKIIKAVNIIKSVDDLGDNLADRLAVAIISEMRDVLSEPEHPVRLQYESWLQGFIERLKTDPALIDRINEVKMRLIDHPAVQDYVNGLWADIHAALKKNLAQEDSSLIGYVEKGLLRMGHKLAEDSALREAINSHVLSAAEQLSGTLRTTLTAHIATTVKGWDEHQLVNQIELSVGRDLQFIRINGTVVGGLVGVALHAFGTLVMPLLR
ncbi:MAG: DUF445 domain-containing protein [Rubrivivax sp.]|nr:MAG: DUF445 domain-containing protein [Rubrivivax sp.]